MKKSKVIRQVLCVAIMLSLLSAGTALAAGSLKEAATWQDFANQIAPFEDSNDLAKRVSALTGTQKSKDSGGVSYYTVIVQADAGPYFVNKVEKEFAGAGPEAPPASSGEYTKVADLSFTTASGAGATAAVYVFNEASDADLQRANANISSALLSQAGVAPDTGRAMQLLSGAMPIINTLLGLIVTIISIGMTVFSALDIIYLAFPAFRDSVDRSIESGGKGTKQNKDGSTSSRWVSDDARNAVKETLEKQQQPWGVYFKRRIIAYIFLAIILFILLTGNIFSITTLITNALSGLFNSLGLG
jgi:hypothetical protein